MTQNTNNKDKRSSESANNAETHAGTHNMRGNVSDNVSDKIVRAFTWVESPNAIEYAIRVLAGLCGFLFFIELVINRHGYAPGEGLWGFYAFVGFFAFTLIVLGAVKLRSWILRDEAYYGVDSVDSESYPSSQLDIQEAKDTAQSDHSGQEQSK